MTDSDMLVFGTPDEMSRFATADSEPLLVLRDVVSKLKDENIGDALTILNNLQERIEDAQSTWSKQNNPLSPIGKENSIPNTPVVDKARAHLESQLEELREQLEVVIEERDEQTDLAKSLEDELSKKDLLIDEQKEEIAMHKQICDDLTSQLTDTMDGESGPNTPTPKKSVPSTDDSSISGKVTSPASEGTREVINKYMENQLDLNALEQGEHERMVEELMTKLEESQQVVEEKSKQLEEVTADLENAQEEIEEQEAAEADLKNRMLVLESTLLKLRGGDEVVTGDVSMNMEDLQERNTVLQNIVTDLKETNADTEELVEALKEDNDDLSNELEGLQKGFEEQKQELVAATETVKSLQLSLQESKEKEAFATARRDELEREVATVKVELDALGSQLSGEGDVLNKKLDLLTGQKSDLSAEIKRQKRDIENKEEQLRVLAAELEQSQGDFTKTKEALQIALDDVEKESRQRAELMKELQGLLLLRQNSPSVDVSMAADDVDLNVSGLSGWGSPENSLLVGVPSVATSGALDSSRDAAGGATSAEVPKLLEKLEDAEKRAAEAVQSGVEHLTKTAILDGECARLRQVSTELKETNAKLLEDVENAKRKEDKYKTLEKTAKKLKAELQATKSALNEAGKYKKDLEDKVTFKEDELRTTYESETDELRHQIEELEKQLKEGRDHMKRVEENADSQDQQITGLMNLRDELQQELESMQKDYDEAMSNVEEVTTENEAREKELREVREELSSTKDGLLGANTEMGRERGDFSRRVEGLNAEKARLEKDVERVRESTKELTDQVKDLQAQNGVANAQVEEMTKTLASVEREKQVLSEQKGRDDEELSKRYKRINDLAKLADEQEEALEQFKAKDYQLLQGQYDSATQDLNSAQEELRNALERASEKEKEIEAARIEYTDLTSRHQVLESALTELQEKDLQDREQRVRDLQKELQTRMQEQSLVESQMADISAQLAQAQNDLLDVRGAETEKKGQIEELVRRLGVVEDEKRGVMDELNQHKEADVKLSMNLAVINDGLSGCLTETSSSNGALSPARASAVAALESLGASSSVVSSEGLGGMVEKLQQNCSEAQKLLFSQGSERTELWHEQESQQHEMDLLNTQVQALQNIRNTLTGDVHRLDEALAASERKVEAKDREVEGLLQSSDEWNAKVRAQVRDLKVAISDAYSHIARLHAAGGDAPSMPLDHIPSSTGAGAGQDASAVSQLSQVNLEMETALRMLVSAMESTSQQAMARKVAIDAAEAALVDQRSQLQQDLDNSAVMEEQIAKDGEKLESAQSLQRQLASVRHDHAQYKVMLSELNKNKIELQAELNSSQAIIGDLRGALTDAEKLCEDYRNQHSTLLEEHDGLSSHMRHLQQQSTAALTRAEDSVSAAETARREVTSLRQEMEEMVRLQKALESELARRKEESAPPTPSHLTRDLEGEQDGSPNTAAVAEESVISMFDSERLLGAVYSSSDQVVVCSLAADPESIQHVHKLQSLSRAALEINSGASMASRYELAIRFMGEMKTWTRNEKKARRVLQSKLADTEKELAKAQHELSERQHNEKQWKEAKHTGDAEIRSLERKLRELHNSTDRRSNDASRLRDSVSNWERRYEEERSLRLQLSKQVQGLDVDLNKARLQTSDDKTTITTLDSKLESSREKADKLEQDVARASEEVRALKTNNSKLVHLLEVDSARVPSSGASAEENRGAKALLGSLQERVAELEGALSAAKMAAQQATQGKTAEELSSASVRRDLESLKGKFALVESRHQEVESERRRLQEDLLDTRAALTSAEQKAQIAEDRFARTEATLGLTTTATGVSDDKLAPFVESNQHQIRALQARLDETDKSRRQAEEERVGLRGQLSELRSAMDRQGSETSTYRVTKEALEQELSQCKQQLASISEQGSSSAQMKELVSSLMNSDEGRDLKKKIREAIITTREVVNLVRADAVSQDGTYFSSPEPKGGSEHILLEATGVRELSEALEAMRLCIGWLRDAPRQRADLVTDNTRQEATLKETHRELSAAQRRHDTAIARMQAELKAVETQLAGEQGKNLALRDKEASVEAEGRASVMQRERLERELRSEKEKNNGLEEDLNELEMQVEEVEELLEEKAAKLSAAEEELKSLDKFMGEDGGAGASRKSGDGDGAVATQQELRALSHHRDALCSTIDRLEEKVRLLSSSAAAARSAAGGAAATMPRDGDSDVRQEARLRSRLEALESVVGIYKAGLMALHGHSVAYSYSQYLASKGFGADLVQHAGGVSVGAWQGWGQLELATLRSSFDAELKAVDGEIIELRGKVRQSQAFSAELSRRFQTLLSESFSGGTGTGMGSSSSGASRVDALRHLEASTSEALEEAARLRTSLHDEKEQSRRRHRQLVDVLNGTVAEKEALEAALKALEISGVAVPALVRRSDFRPNQGMSSFGPTTHATHTNSSFSFQSPVKSYRSSSPSSSGASGVGIGGGHNDEHHRFQDPNYGVSLDLPGPPSPTMHMPPAPAATHTATTTITTSTSAATSKSSAYRLRTKGTTGRGALRVRRAAGGSSDKEV